jgi:hypothetical protein
LMTTNGDNNLATVPGRSVRRSRIAAQDRHLFQNLSNDPVSGRRITRVQVEKRQPLAIQANIVQQRLDPPYALFGPQVPFDIPTGPLRADEDDHGIGTGLKSPQKEHVFHHARAGQFHKFGLEFLSTGQRRCIALAKGVDTMKYRDFWCEPLPHIIFPSVLLDLIWFKIDWPK